MYGALALLIVGIAVVGHLGIDRHDEMAAMRANGG
jgi:hypothetical protein